MDVLKKHKNGLDIFINFITTRHVTFFIPFRRNGSKSFQKHYVWIHPSVNRKIFSKLSQINSKINGARCKWTFVSRFTQDSFTRPMFYVLSHYSKMLEFYLLYSIPLLFSKKPWLVFPWRWPNFRDIQQLLLAFKSYFYWESIKHFNICERWEQLSIRI